MKKKTVNVTTAIKDGACHVVCGDGLEFDIKPLDGSVVILHHIEKDNKQALNNRVKMKLKDADIFATEKHGGIVEVDEEKYVSISSDELRNPAAYQNDDEDEFEEQEIQAEDNDDFSDDENIDDENGGYTEDDESDDDNESEDDDFLSDGDDENDDEDGDMSELFGDDDEESEGGEESEDNGDEYGWDDDEEEEPETPAAPVIPVSAPTPVMQASTESVIADDMIITGDIITKSSVTIRGGIDGNVTAVKSVTVYGGVNGDINAGEDVTIKNNGTEEATEIDGNITAKGRIYVDSSCVIIGDIKAEDAVIEGSVLGSVDVRNKITVCSSARIKGNITSREIQVETGALIAGTCMQSYAESTADDFFGQFTSRLKEQQKDAEAVKKSISSKSEDVTMKELI